MKKVYVVYHMHGNMAPDSRVMEINEVWEWTEDKWMQLRGQIAEIFMADPADVVICDVKPLD